MKRLLTLCLLALPLAAQYQIPVWQTAKSKYVWLTPGPGLILTINATGGTIDAIPPVVIQPMPSPEAFVATAGQATFTLKNLTPIKYVAAYRNGLYLNPVQVSIPPVTPDYTTSTDKQTITLEAGANAGDLIVVNVWR
jgi:hypothetical protein